MTIPLNSRNSDFIDEPAKKRGGDKQEGNDPLDTATGGQRATFAEDGTDPRAQYIHETLFYVPSIARRYLGRGLSYDELIAAGNLGLVEAALRYDPDRNVRFTTYANWWIRKSIIEALGHQFGPMRLPRYQYDKLKCLRDARSSWLAEHGREPDREELSTAAGLSVLEVDRLLSLVTAAISLDSPVNAGDARNVGDTLEDHATEKPDRSLVKRDLAQRLHQRLAELGRRERQVLALRFGLAEDTPMTLRETGRRLGISRERVRQVELRALTKLKDMI